METNLIKDEIVLADETTDEIDVDLNMGDTAADSYNDSDYSEISERSI